MQLAKISYTMSDIDWLGCPYRQLTKIKRVTMFLLVVCLFFYFLNCISIKANCSLGDNDFVSIEKSNLKVTAYIHTMHLMGSLIYSGDIKEFHYIHI